MEDWQESSVGPIEGSDGGLVSAEDVSIEDREADCGGAAEKLRLAIY